MQKFAEELFKRLNKSQGEKFETRMIMMNVISRVIGVHKLSLLNFYPFMQKYILPHQRDAPKILAILVQVPLAVPDLVASETIMISLTHNKGTQYMRDQSFDLYAVCNVRGARIGLSIMSVRCAQSEGAIARKCRAV